ncbi:MAG: BTAD domain-containing putative transcriptional regulator [Ilumatobacteraceae bacterium]
MVIAPDGTATLEPLGLTFAVIDSASTTTSLDVNHIPVRPHSQRHETNSNGTGHVGTWPPPTIHTALTSPIPGGDPRLGAATPVTESADIGDVDAVSSETSQRLDTERMVIHVLGAPTFAARPTIKPRELILAVLLACRGGTVAASSAQDALWGGKPVQPKTTWNLYSNTRAALGEFDDGTPLMPNTDRTRGTLRLDPRVTTDLHVLRDVIDEAQATSSSEAIGLLRTGLDLIDGPPFDADGYDWAHRDQLVTDATTTIHQAVHQLLQLAAEAGHIDIARSAITRGLRALPGDEQLYRARMRLESDIGNLAGVIAAYQEVVVYLSDLDSHPAHPTTALFNELTRGTSAPELARPTRHRGH